MAAAASSASDEKPSCCPPGSLGAAVVLDDARTLLGKMETVTVSGVGGDGDGDAKKTVETPVYVVAPPEGTALKGTVVAIYDVFGLNGGRFKSVCDALALAGFAVAGPDFYGKGTSIADVGGFGSDGGNALLKANTWEDQADGTPGVGAKVAAAAALLQSRFGGEGGDQKKPGVIGFCWGAYMTFRACADADAFACGVSCHPAYKLAEFIFNSTQEELAKAVASPQLIMPAGNDPENIKEGGDLLKLLTNGHEVHTFEDQTHGWVTRGDTNDAAVKAAVEKAITYAIDFFTAKL